MIDILLSFFPSAILIGWMKVRPALVRSSILGGLSLAVGARCVFRPFLCWMVYCMNFRLTART